ncbi:hypothetical protein LQF76_09825 [Gloeomargaritales cyanobacterium VI4D9]|nr:hypothetical protein LQF76_09825 [Gloeomargaritales cyanobacterium VI4D9]
MGVIGRLFGAVFGFIGGIFGAIFGIFRRRPQGESPKKQETAFFLDPEEAKSLGRESESRSATPVASTEAKSVAKPEAVVAKPAPTPTLVFSSGSPDLRNRRRPGPNMSSFLDMAKQIRRA